MPCYPQKPIQETHRSTRMTLNTSPSAPWDRQTCSAKTGLTGPAEAFPVPAPDAGLRRLQRYRLRLSCRSDAGRRIFLLSFGTAGMWTHWTCQPETAFFFPHPGSYADQGETHWSDMQPESHASWQRPLVRP